MVNQEIDESNTVFIGGIPKDSDIEDVNIYLLSICGNSPFNLITDSKSRLRGFAFVSFSDKNDIKRFLSKPHSYNGKQLDCKSSLEQSDYVDASLNNIREPKKIYADDIPKQYTKKTLQESFLAYGEIEEIILIEKAKKPKNFAYITFADTDSAQKCIKDAYIKLDPQTFISVVYARPKFSKKMLQTVPVEIQKYIKQVQKRTKEYDPTDFAALEDIVDASVKKSPVNKKIKNDHFNLNEDFSPNRMDNTVQKTNDLPLNYRTKSEDGSHILSFSNQNRRITNQSRINPVDFVHHPGRINQNSNNVSHQLDQTTLNNELLQSYQKQKGQVNNQNFNQNFKDIAYYQNLLQSRNSSFNLQQLKNSLGIKGFIEQLSVPTNPLDMRTQDRNAINLTKSNEISNRNLKSCQDEHLPSNQPCKENQTIDDNIQNNQSFIRAFDSRDKSRNLYINKIVYSFKDQSLNRADDNVQSHDGKSYRNQLSVFSNPGLNEYGFNNKAHRDNDNKLFNDMLTESTDDPDAIYDIKNQSVFQSNKFSNSAENLSIPNQQIKSVLKNQKSFHKNEWKIFGNKRLKL